MIPKAYTFLFYNPFKTNIDFRGNSSCQKSPNEKSSGLTSVQLLVSNKESGRKIFNDVILS